MAKNILKEAIADAKAVREVALANAKAALEEAFTPKLQSMLSAKLSETLNEEEEEDLDENVYEDEDTVDEITGMETEENLDEEIDLEEILNELELEEGEDSEEETVDEAKHEDDELEEANTPDKPNYRADQVADTFNNAEDVHQGLNEGGEFDLDALLEEINNLDETEDEVYENRFKVTNHGLSPNEKNARETNRLRSMGYDVDEVEEGQFDGDPDTTLSDKLRSLATSASSYEDWQAKAKEAGASDGIINSPNWKPYVLKNMGGETNEVVGTAIAGVAGLVAAAGGLSRIEMAAEDPEFQAKYPKVAKALAMMQSIGKSAADTKRMEETAKDEELAETKAALETVRTELNEVNLLNSKLLYVNRIFKANNLNEAQKLRVVETLDNASNVKEAKLIYETIKDTFNVAKSTKTTPKKSIREGLGMASKAAGTSTAPKKPVLNESNDMVSRMQKLANIKINQ